MDTNPAATQALHFELRVTLTLQPEGLQPAWEADLLGSRPDERLHFESLPALIRYLAGLETQGPPCRGIR
jgi:hypothetical protein